jgi:hypothetical protein
MRDVRLIEQGGMVVAYPEPHRTPVLPAGWAPLSREQQDAVLNACDAAPESIVFRLGSLWDPCSEYRVYHLANDSWGGLSIAARCDDRNQQLLGLAWDTARAVAIAIDFFNWDLEANGQHWRLNVRTARTDQA